MIPGWANGQDSMGSGWTQVSVNSFPHRMKIVDGNGNPQKFPIVFRMGTRAQVAPLRVNSPREVWVALEQPEQDTSNYTRMCLLFGYQKVPDELAAGLPWYRAPLHRRKKGDLQFRLPLTVKGALHPLPIGQWEGLASTNGQQVLMALQAKSLDVVKSEPEKRNIITPDEFRVHPLPEIIIP